MEAAVIKLEADINVWLVIKPWVENWSKGQISPAELFMDKVRRILKIIFS